jgi:hypothetical protein
MLFMSGVVIAAGLCYAIIFPYFLPQAVEPFFTEITGEMFADLTQAQITFHNLLCAVIGGILFGWGLMMGLLSYRLLKAPEDWIWSVITVSVFSWYILDTVMSLVASSSLNIILNTSLLLLALPALIAKRQAIINGFRNLS